MVKACLVPSRGFLSRNSYAEIPEPTASVCLIPQTVRTNALVDHGGFPLRVAMNWSRSSPCTPAAGYIISWLPYTTIRLYSHPIVRCIFISLLPILQTIMYCASRFVFAVPAFAVSQWAKSCLRCSWVSAGGILDEVPDVLLDSVPLSPCCGVCGAMICCCGREEMMIRKWSGKTWGRRQRNEVVRPEEYIVRFKSKLHA